MALHNDKKYIVTITAEYESGCFYVPVVADSPEKAQEYATNKLCNEYPIYWGRTHVYNVREAV